MEQRGQAERLQRDRLAAGVRPADDERAEVAEIEVDRDGGRRVEQRVPRAEEPHLVRDLDRRAAPAARDRAARDGQSIAPVASTSAASAAALSATAAESSRRMRSTSSRSSPAASDWRLFSSTTSNGSTKRVWPEPDESWTIPFTLRRALGFTASTGRPPRSATKSSCRCSRSAGRAGEATQLLGDALTAVAQLAAQLAEQRRRVVAEVGAVVLDAAADLLGERREAGSIAAASSASSGAVSALVERGPRAQAAADRGRDVGERLRVRARHRGRVGRGLADVLDPVRAAAPRLRRAARRLGRQRLPPRDLVRVG